MVEPFHGVELFVFQFGARRDFPFDRIFAQLRQEAFRDDFFGEAPVDFPGKFKELHLGQVAQRTEGTDRIAVKGRIPDRQFDFVSVVADDPAFDGGERRQKMSADAGLDVFMDQPIDLVFISEPVDRT